MASIADLRMRPDMEHSYLLLIEGVPFAFTDEPAIAEGSGWWTLDDRRLLLGLTVPATLRVSLDLETGLIEEDQASFQLMDLDGTVPAFFGGLQKQLAELGPRLTPFEDPATGLFDGGGGALDHEGAYIGTEALGPEGQRNYYSATPWAEMPGQDHPGHELPRPVHTTNAVGPYLVEGRRVALYRLVWDPDTQTWPTFGAHVGAALNGGWSPQLWWGVLRQSGRVEGRVWTINCVGPGSWLRRSLNARTTARWYPVTVDLELEDAERLVGITFRKEEHNANAYLYGIDFWTYTIPDGTPAEIAAYLSTAIAAVSNLSGDAGVWTDGTPISGAAGVISFGLDGCTISTLESCAYAATMALRLHRKVWKALGYDPDYPEDLEGPQPLFGVNPGGYHTGIYSTVPPGMHPLIQDPSLEWDGDGIPRTFAPLYPGGVSILSGAGGVLVHLSAGEEDVIYCEGQSIRPASTDLDNTAARLWVFRGKLQLPGEPEPIDTMQVAACSWAEFISGEVAKDDTGITHGLTIDQWLDPRLFGFNSLPIDPVLGWASVNLGEDGVQIEASPLAHFGARYSELDRVDDTIIRILLSTGTAVWDEAAQASDCTDDNAPAYAAGNQTPGDNDPGNGWPAGDFEIFDLGLQIPAAMVDEAGIAAAVDDLPAGALSPLAVGKVAVQGGPIQSAELLQALLAPRGWCFSLIRGRIGVWAPHVPAESKFDPDVDFSIGISDLHGEAGDPASTIPTVELRPVSPFDRLAVTYAGLPTETWLEGQAELKGQARDPGSRARSGTRSRDLPCPDLPATEWWVEEPGPNPPLTWIGVFRLLWERQIPGWLAQPHRLVTNLRISRPKGQDIYPGQILQLTNPWPANSTGTYGVTEAFARVLAVTHETDSCACVVDCLVEAAPAGALRWAPIVRVLDDAEKPEDRYDAASRTFYLQDWGHAPPLQAFIKPANLSAEDEPAVIWGLQFDGVTWTHTFTTIVESVDVAAKTLTHTDDGLEGTFYSRMYTVLVLAPLSDPLQAAWVALLFPQHTALPASGTLKPLPL